MQLFNYLKNCAVRYMNMLKEAARTQFRWCLVVVGPRHLTDWYYRHSVEVFTCSAMPLTPVVC